MKYLKTRDVLIFDEWVQVVLNPDSKHSFYDNKKKIITLNDLNLTILIHEISHVVHYLKFDLIMEKIESNSIKSRLKLDYSNEYIATFTSTYAMFIIEQAEYLLKIMS